MNQYTIELQAYKEQAINTMTPGEMLILLYDEAVKRLRRAKLLANNSDFENFDKEIKRAQEIVTYLNDALDRRYAISNELTRMYNFFHYQLARITASRNLVLIDELERGLEGVGANDAEDGAEDLFAVDAHLGLDVVEKTGAEEETFAAG